ncbi:NFACT RNA binding domain-containing protein [Reichenbachiella agarivorans]|uniref:NFACT RNA binding domain-containing protein n=1 Tax=Reichenbachiella agarivorans TaxID=2979464 RepID=A0ABY6CN36_9BACT|nr:NFACT RNA binding domain-containing protein [Reichenbachiella agarivorans]UXP31450.1 NFACT RNA binding domain-containing protein [Reichenbachiella agarivorans]
MQFNYYFLRLLADDLSTHLIGKKLISCFSQNRNELILRFEDADAHFHIKANLEGEMSLLSFPENFARAKRNSVDLFQKAYDKEVSSIKVFNNERCLSIYLGTFTLLFKLHGRRSNVILYQMGDYHSMFRNDMPKDQEILLTALDRNIDQSEAAWVKEDFNLKQLFPTFDKTIYQYLEEKGYSMASVDQKKSLLQDCLSILTSHQIYLYLGDYVPKLSLVPIALDTEPKVFSDSVEACNAFAKAFFVEYHFKKEKSTALRQLEKEISKTEAYIANTMERIQALEQSRGYDEIANILMANLHVAIRPEQNEITLFDFYNNQDIKIKIKAHQSLQLSAETYYRKSKNQGIEISTAQKNLERKEAQLLNLLQQQESIVSTQSLHELRDHIKVESTQSMPDKVLPFIQVNIDGYEVLVGKNAKNNDLLTQKYAKKNDLWLHAKDVAGSHVVIRTVNNAQVPKHVIEQSAEIAAWYSKRKNDTLCPVIYTHKKYVRKPKGSLPGQVMVDREEVILVAPKRLYAE